MKRPVKLIALILSGILALSAVIGCSADSQPDASVPSTTGQAESATNYTTAAADYTARDLDASWDAATATAITLNGSSATVSGKGAAVSGSTVTITEKGTYVLSGTLTNGQVRVEADDEAKVQVVLNGVDITNPAGPALYGLQGDKIIITLPEGTVNHLRDGSAYVLPQGEDEPHAALFSKTDLSINGTGTLEVQGNYQNGIVSKDDLVIASGILNVTAVKDGIRGKDSVAVKGAVITITAGEDGIQSSNSEDTGKGWIVVDGGVLTITAADDAITAETDLVVNGGTITILDSYEGLEGKTITITGGTIALTAQDDGINAASGTAAAGAGGRPAAPGTRADSSLYIRITGGSIHINANGDGIDSNGSLFIEGGTITVSGPTANGNGALDYDGTCTVTGGRLAIAGSSGMAQSPGESSLQSSVTVIYSTTQAAGTPATLTDANGTVLLSFSPEKPYQAVVFSAPELAPGSTYSLYTGGTLTEPADGPLTRQGMLTGGTRLTAVTLTNTVTRIAEDGSAVSAGMGGPGGGRPGNRPPRPEGTAPVQ